MRWIFLTLAVANLTAFAWALVAGSGSSAPVANKKLRNPYDRYPEIVLLRERAGVRDVEARLSDAGSSGSGGELVDLSELEVIDKNDLEAIDKNDLGAIDKKDEGVIEEDVVADGEGLIGEVAESAEVESGGEPDLPKHDNKLLCELIGPFESGGVASNFVERLKAIEVVSSLKDIELPAGPGYWIYLEPLASRQEAIRLLRELQAKRIDSYVIPKGELANGISLGMFSKKTLSDARVREMTAVGLAPKVEEIERSYREVWVMLEPGEDSKMSSLSWERAMEGIKGLERRQNYCLDVASR